MPNRYLLRGIPVALPFLVGLTLGGIGGYNYRAFSSCPLSFLPGIECWNSFELTTKQLYIEVVNESAKDLTIRLKYIDGLNRMAGIAAEKEKRLLFGYFDKYVLNDPRSEHKMLLVANDSVGQVTYCELFNVGDLNRAGYRIVIPANPIDCGADAQRFDALYNVDQ